MRRMVLAVALLALLTGCSALPFVGPPPSDDRAVEAVDAANATVAEVDTYRFTTTLHVAASNGDRTRSVTADGNGSVNVSARRMQATTRTRGDTVHSYVDGDRAYRECGEPWGGYAVENVSAGDRWALATPLHRQLALFERSNVYWRGNRTLDLDGEETRTVLVVAHPGRDTLQSLMDRRQSESVDLRRGSLENATARLWIDPETDRPVQSELRLVIEQGGATATARITIRYTDYGEPVEVSIPWAVYDDPYELGCPGS